MDTIYLLYQVSVTRRTVTYRHYYRSCPRHGL